MRALMLLLLASSGCTRTINVRYVQAPKVLAPADVERVVVTDPAALGAEDRAAVERAATHLVRRTNEAPGFRAVYVPAEQSGVRPGEAWTAMGELLRQHDAQAVISLDRLDFEAGQVQAERGEVVEQVNGRERVRPIFHMSRRVQATSGWTFLHPEREAPIDRRDGHWEATTLKASAQMRMNARQQVNGQVPGARLSLAERNANYYANRVLPQVVRRNRTLFTGGKLKAGNGYAKVNKWTEARRAWERHMDAGGKRGMKARFNAAVAIEVLGDLEEAYATLDPLLGVWNRDVVKDYADRLRFRVDNERRLEAGGLD